jgi:DNA-binding MarR family transcriptional regulator
MKPKSKKSLGALMWQVSLTWQREQKKALNNLGLTLTQSYVLVGVCEYYAQGVSPSMTRLSEYLSFNKMMTSEVVKTLINKKYIIKKSDPQDRRGWCLEPSTKGLLMMKRARKQSFFFEQQFFKFSNDNKKNLYELLEHLLQKQN